MDLFGNVLNTDGSYCNKLTKIYSCASLQTVYFCILETNVLLPEVINALEIHVYFITLAINGKKGFFFDTAFENTITSCKMKLYSKMYPKLQDTSTIKQINRHIFMYREHQNTKQLLI